MAADAPSVGSFDTASLERELGAALEADAAYQRTDAMKKRAITAAGSYDEFRHMVACAHLQPLTRKEIEGLSDTVAQRGWANRTAVARGATAAATAAAQADVSALADSIEGARAGARGNGAARKKNTAGGRKGKKKKAGFKQVDPAQAPRSAHEFQTVWRRHCPSAEAKRRYLQLTGARAFGELFRTELAYELLLDVARQLAGAAEEDAENWQLLDWLEAMTSSQRFSLSWAFLSAAEKGEVEGLLGLISPSDENEARVGALRALLS